MYRAMQLFFLAVLLSVPFALTAPNTARADNGELVLRLVDDHVIPGYEDFAVASKTLDDEVTSWCLASQSDPDAMIAAFKAAFEAWARIAHIDLGPVRYLDRRFRIQFWPDPRGLTARELRPLLEAGAKSSGTLPLDMTEASVAVQGFPALERLLPFPANTESLPKQTVCPIARGITRNLASMSSDIVLDWSNPEGFRDAIKRSIDGTGPYDSADSALADLMTGVLAGLQGVSDLQIARPLGETLAKARPEKAEAWRSEVSLELIQARLRSYADAYGLEGRGLDEALRGAGHAELADLMRRAFAQTLATVDGIDGSLSEGVRDPKVREHLSTLGVEVSALRALLATKVAPALGVPAGFNSLDGD